MARVKNTKALVAAALPLGLALSEASQAETAPSAASAEVVVRDLTLDDAGRAVPVRVFAPASGCTNCTLLIFSHGANASYSRYDVLLKDWAARGYVVAAPQHVDSEEHPRRDDYKTADGRLLRMRDYAVVDAAFTPNAPQQFASLSFSGTVVAAGHSYGALIAQIAGGARIQRPDGDFTRNWRTPKAVIAISPPATIAGFTSLDGWSHVSVPQLVVTGTTDVLPGFVDDWRRHLDSFAAARPGLGFALIFEGMDHNFNGAYCRITPEGAKAAPQVARLNAAIDHFIRKAVGGSLPSAADWVKTQSFDGPDADGVEARAN
ncbi:MAG TPA: hypothetical protein VIG90_05125 [Pedomonas sp.]|uniref:alpha/beta hydrolase family protein n=1 Tax=Pedomonas sp. TaxID=2976421 RepID=UPI002F41A7DB